MIKEFRQSAIDLRSFAREHISQRIKEVENMDYVPNDILTAIIKNFGI
jgi:hypothetical protein